MAVISAHGDIDASNAGTLAEYTLGHVTGCRGLIRDLRGLDFFGARVSRRYTRSPPAVLTPV